MNPINLAAAAERLAGEGIAVFPCRADKRPATSHGKNDATSDPAAARRLFLRARDAVIIARTTGAAAGIVVVDVDPQGMEWMRNNIRRLGDTRIDQTPRGGYHIFFRCPDNPPRCSAGKLSFGVDIRGEGGSIIIPPSPGYRTVNEADELAVFPAWILRRLAFIDRKREKKALAMAENRGGAALAGSSAGLERFVAASRPGERNGRLFWAACRAAGSGSDVGARLVRAGMAAGLDAIEAAATVRSGLAAGKRGARGT